MVDFRRHDPNVAGTATQPDRSVPGDTNRVEFGARRPVLRTLTLCPKTLLNLVGLLTSGSCSTVGWPECPSESGNRGFTRCQRLARNVRNRLVPLPLPTLLSNREVNTPRCVRLCTPATDWAASETCLPSASATGCVAARTGADSAAASQRFLALQRLSGFGSCGSPAPRRACRRRSARTSRAASSERTPPRP